MGYSNHLFRMGGLGTIVREVGKSVADKVAGPVTDVTIAGIEKVGHGWYKEPPYLCVDTVYKVLASRESQELSGYYSVRKMYWYHSDESKEAKAATNLKHLSELASDIKQTTMNPSQLEQITHYLSQHPEGLTISMRTKGTVLPNNLLQKAYESLPK